MQFTIATILAFAAFTTALVPRQSPKPLPRLCQAFAEEAEGYPDFGPSCCQVGAETSDGCVNRKCNRQHGTQATPRPCEQPLLINPLVTVESPSPETVGDFVATCATTGRTAYCCGSGDDRDSINCLEVKAPPKATSSPISPAPPGPTSGGLLGGILGGFNLA